MNFPSVKTPWAMPTWLELLLSLLVLLAACFLWLFTFGYSAAERTALWIAWGFASLFLFRNTWRAVFGPVLFYDMLRTGRRGRFLWMRFLYILCVVFFLFVVFADFADDYSPSMTSRQQAEFAQRFFYTFMMVQFLVAVVLTPGYVAGAITDEKERKTLEFVLATDLDNREIVLSKLLARLANIALVLLAGVPILAMIQFLGGIDPNLILAGSAATLLTVFSLASLAIYNSTFMRRSRDAIGKTYLQALFFIIGVNILWAVSLAYPNFPSLENWDSPITLVDIMPWLNAGNFIFAISEVFSRRVGVLAAVVPKVLFEYAVFHLALGFGLLTIAVLGLRRRALLQMERRGTLKAKGPTAAVPTLTVTGPPVLWRETRIEGRRSGTLAGKIRVGLAVIITLLPIPYIYWEIDKHSFEMDGFYQGVNVWIRVLSTALSLIIVLRVAVAAAGSIQSERQKQTWECLLLTQLENDEILFGKWAGSVWTARYFFLWVAGVWCLGIAMDAVSPVMFPVYLAVMGVYILFATGLGLACSFRATTPTRATNLTMAFLLLFGLGHWLLFMCISIYLDHSTVSKLGKICSMLTPPVMLAVIPTRTKHLMEMDRHTQEMVEYGCLAWTMQAVLAVAIMIYCWETAHQFIRRQAANKSPRIRPPAKQA